MAIEKHGLISKSLLRSFSFTRKHVLPFVNDLDPLVKAVVLIGLEVVAVLEPGD
jgi:hypothetical protein